MNRLNNNMYACGENGLPQTLFFSSHTWQLQYHFKHDFFACTGLYSCPETGQRCVLKVNRLQSFFGIPLSWMGRFLCNREYKIILRLQGIRQIPSLLGRFGRNGFVYEYINGKSLDEHPVLPNNFFFILKKLLEEIHHRNVCYMDLNKRGNILLGNDGRPYLIDFQISLILPGRFFVRLRRRLQQTDHYHLLKHKRRFRPDLMTKAEWEMVGKPQPLINIHRCIGNPFRFLRRQILRFLYKKQILHPNSGVLSTPENDHRRFLA